MQVGCLLRIGLDARDDHRPCVGVGQIGVHGPLPVGSDVDLDVGAVEVRVVAVLAPVRRVGVAVVDLGPVRLLGEDRVLDVAQWRPRRWFRIRAHSRGHHDRDAHEHRHRRQAAEQPGAQRRACRKHHFRILEQDFHQEWGFVDHVPRLRLHRRPNSIAPRPQCEMQRLWPLTTGSLKMLRCRVLARLTVGGSLPTDAHVRPRRRSTRLYVSCMYGQSVQSIA